MAINCDQMWWRTLVMNSFLFPTSKKCATVMERHASQHGLLDGPGQVGSAGEAVMNNFVQSDHFWDSITDSRTPISTE